MSSDVDDVLAVHTQFYAAFERADFDAMEPLRADAPYLQVVLTDVEASVVGDLASVTCTENVLSATSDTPVGVFAGGSAVATNVFRRSTGHWRLWVHHASPVLSGPDPDQAEPDEGDA
jgi:hypothetical protein